MISFKKIFLKNKIFVYNSSNIPPWIFLWLIFYIIKLPKLIEKHSEEIYLLFINKLDNNLIFFKILASLFEYIWSIIIFLGVITIFIPWINFKRSIKKSDLEKVDDDNNNEIYSYIRVVLQKI